MNGVINFYKPPGMTSAQAVAFIKRLTGVKTGHAGTLDPEAAGVLPILSGLATRICDCIMDGEKQYLAEIAFGEATDTQDAQGNVTGTGTNYPGYQDLQGILCGFTGEIWQMPPQYSALKTGGETAYKLARKGLKAELKARRIEIRRIDLLQETERHGFLMRILCGKGTYIRTLCNDIGAALDCPAHLRFLLREKSGRFSLADAVTPEEVKEWCGEGMPIPRRWFTGMADALSALPRYEVPARMARQALNGAALPIEDIVQSGTMTEQTKVCLFLQGELLGMYLVHGDHLKVAAMLREG